VVKGFSHGVLVHDDFVQQGRIALLNSIKRFKFEEGTRFSTYAYAAIKRQVAREIDDFGSMIRVPVYFHNRLGVVKAAREDFVAKNGRMPKVSELAVLTNLKEDEVRQALDVERQSNVLSIDAQFHGDDPTGDAVIAFNDFLRSSDESVEDVNMRKIDNRRLKSRLNSSLKVIGGRNGEILRLRFGMTFPNPRQNSQRKINALIKRKKGGLTLEEVGKHYGVTSERIRQLERDGLDKLRMALRKKDFL
ncbi:MAG: sigma-70 family RNA polymerase sigma factor, partial [Candidatus Micrarchaeia archaeon]